MDHTQSAKKMAPEKRLEDQGYQVQLLSATSTCPFRDHAFTWKYVPQCLHHRVPGGRSMKLLYIANARLPTEKAHGIQIMKMCESFAKAGADVTLVVPMRIQSRALRGKDPYKYYSVKKSFTIKKLPCIDIMVLPPKSLTFLLQTWSFMIVALFYSLFTRYDLIYTREEYTSSILSLFRKVVYEAHVFPKKGHSWYKRWMPRTYKVVTISGSLKRLYSKFLNKKNIFVAHDGVDMRQFAKLPSKESCRRKLKIPAGKNIAMYTGHLYKWKGIDTVVEGAKKVKDLIYVVGGTPQDVKKYREIVSKEKITNLKILGYKPPHLVPSYLRAADVLLLTSPAKYKISKYYTSPLKLFEYMASKTPILASDVPSSKEVLNVKNSVFFTADDAKAFANRLNWMFKNPKKCKPLATQAYKDVQEYTWFERGENILKFLQ